MEETAVEIQIEDKSDPEKATVLASKKNERRLADSLPKLLHY